MQQEKSTRIVANWIFVGVAMLIVQVLLGGITRLTGSGLSITEWKPIMGALPPMSSEEWQTAFSKYQQIAQFKYLNQSFTVSDFKFIFFWEWFHRLWARFISVVFAIPFIYFLVKKYFKSWMVAPLIILFLLGAMQGAIGWIMVKSGLNDNDVYVSHIRLAAHFLAAMVLICYAVVFGLKLTVTPGSFVSHGGLKKGALILIVLVAIQLMYGAFMAGLKAAAAAPTWPSINGSMIPDTGTDTISNILFHNKISIHFIHRTMAYLIGICVFAWWWKAISVQSSALFIKSRNSMILLVLAQILLGIFTVLTSAQIVMGKFGIFEWLAELHQLTGMLLLLSVVANFYLLSNQKSTAYSN